MPPIERRPSPTIKAVFGGQHERWTGPDYLPSNLSFQDDGVPVIGFANYHSTDGYAQDSIAHKMLATCEPYGLRLGHDAVVNGTVIAEHQYNQLVRAQGTHSRAEGCLIGAFATAWRSREAADQREESLAMGLGLGLPLGLPVVLGGLFGMTIFALKRARRHCPTLMGEPPTVPATETAPLLPA